MPLPESLSGDPSLPGRVVIVTGGNRGLGREMALALLGDVADWSDCQRVVAETQARFGPVHVLINNVGRGMRLISETFNTVPTKFWQADVAA